jgi:predicted Zn-dependent protease
MALGRAYLAANDMQQAVTIFNRLAVVQPKSPQAYLGLADASLALKDRPGGDAQPEACAGARPASAAGPARPGGHCAGRQAAH